MKAPTLAEHIVLLPRPNEVEVLRAAQLPPDPYRSSTVVGNPPGLVEDGNIDLTSRPQVKLPDGRTATVRSRSFNFDGDEVLLPTISDDGRILTDDEAVAQYQESGRHLGKFKDSASANEYALNLSAQQQKFYGLESKAAEQPAPGVQIGVEPSVAAPPKPRMRPRSAPKAPKRKQLHPDQVQSFLKGIGNFKRTGQ